MSELSDKRTFTPRRLAVGIQIQNRSRRLRLRLRPKMSSRPMTSWTSCRGRSRVVEATEPLTRFAVPLSDEAVKEARKAAVPQTTQKDVLLV